MTTFSKGMKQKVLLISGMLHNPEVIFLDEPLSGLDANTVILVKEILAQLKQAGKTIFYSSHIMDVVEKISDRIVLINQGAIIANGTFEELKSQRESGSLEQIFNQLTGNNEHVHLAEEFIQIMKQ
jgi:ABC-2 type transport system ATP-binding protein